MSYQQLDLNLLKVFDAIYAERNLTRAARILNISQPAVSNALQRLRESLDDPLFIRERRGVTPTPFADSLAAPVQNALQLVRSGLSSREAFTPQQSQRTFRVSMNDPAEALFLPSLVLEMAKLAPTVDIHSSYVGRHELANEMAVGAVDLAIEVPMPNDGRLQHSELINESYACVVRPKHRALNKEFTLENYLALEHVHVSARRRGLGHVDRALADQGITRHIKVRTRNPGLAASIVKNTDLSMSVPERFAGYYNLKPLPLPFEVPPLAWRLYWPVRSEYDPGNIWLRQLIIDIAERYQRGDIQIF